MMYEIRSYSHKRSNTDRRGAQDRRERYDIAVVDRLGLDRRRPYSERRQTQELRQGWTRVSDWSSVCVAALSV